MSGHCWKIIAYRGWQYEGKFFFFPPPKTKAESELAWPTAARAVYRPCPETTHNIWQIVLGNLQSRHVVHGCDKTVLSWPCLMFQSRDLSTCMFYFCLLILRCILFRFHFSKHLENNPCLHPVAQRRVSGEAKHSASKSNNGTSSETKQHMSSSHTYGDVSDQTLLQSGHCLPNDSIPTQAVANHTCPGPTVYCLVVTSMFKKRRRRNIRKQLHIVWITLLYQWCF